MPCLQQRLGSPKRKYDCIDARDQILAFWFVPTRFSLDVVSASVVTMPVVCETLGELPVYLAPFDLRCYSKSMLCLKVLKLVRKRSG